MFNALVVISGAEKQYHAHGFIILLMGLIMSTRCLATVFSASSAKRELNHLDPEAFLGEEKNDINYYYFLNHAYHSPCPSFVLV